MSKIQASKAGSQTSIERAMRPSIFLFKNLRLIFQSIAGEDHPFMGEYDW
jgi:hypothetical protein